jgi:hypothetical protein
MKTSLWDWTSRDLISAYCTAARFQQVGDPGATFKHVCLLLNNFKYSVWRTGHVGRDSSVGIATRYGLDGPEIDIRWGRNFPYRYTLKLGTPSTVLHNEYNVPFLGMKRPGRGSDHPLPYSIKVKERVELYLYPPSGPSWPVPAWPLPLNDGLQICQKSRSLQRIWNSRNHSESPWLRLSVSGLLTWRAVRSLRPVHVGFVVNEAAQTQISLQVH